MKNKILLGLFVVLNMLFITNAKAYTHVDAPCVDSGTCLLLCNYTSTFQYNSSTKTNDHLSVFYHLDDGSYSLYSDYHYYGDWGGGWQTRIYKLKKGSFGRVFSNGGTNVYAEGGVTFSEDNFKCPTYGYVDTNGAGVSTEVCFDNDGTSCAANHDDAGTDFGTNSKNFISNTKDYDIEQDIQVYYNDSAYRDLKCEEIFDYSNPDSVSLLITEKDFNEDIWKDFNDNYLHGKKAPKFVTTFQENRSKDLFASLKETRTQECINETQDLLNKGQISQEEYDNRMKIMGNVDWDAVEEDIDNAYKAYLAGIRYVTDVVGDADNVMLGNATGLDFCSSNGVKHVLNIIGLVGFFAKIAIPLLLIIMGSLDFVSALKDPDEKGVKDQAFKFAKRVMAAIIIFFIPTIINFVFSLIDNATGYNTNFTDCTECIFRPTAGTCTYDKLGD